MWNRSAWSPSGRATTTSPSPVRISASSTDSCGSPDRNEDASMPRPVTAPPRVIVRSCGTTRGMRPCGSVAATRFSYVVIPWTRAVRLTGSRSTTWVRSETSSRAESVVRWRKRFDVRFPSRTGASGWESGQVVEQAGGRRAVPLVADRSRDSLRHDPMKSASAGSRAATLRRHGSRRPVMASRTRAALLRARSPASSNSVSSNPIRVS